MRYRIMTLVALLSATWAPSALAQNSGRSGSDDRSHSPYFQIEGGDEGVDRLPLEDTKVDVHISGVIAAVTVRQVYENEGGRPINATYVFPASTRAAVSGMTMRIGVRVVEAVIQERERARRTFERAKQAGQGAALLEQARPNVFEMSVANIMPSDRVEVELRYSELVVPTDGVYEFVYPTVVGPRYTRQTTSVAPDSEPWSRIDYMTRSTGIPSLFDLDATLSAGMRIQEVAVPSHEVDTEWSAGTMVRVSLAEAERTKANRDFILRYRLADDAVTSGLLLQEGENESFFMLLLEPPERVTTDQIPPREFIFVLDVSGSMNGFPLNTAKALLQDLVGGLRPSDSFNVLLFSGQSRLMSERSVTASAAGIVDAHRFIGEQGAGGGTELSEALRRALALPRAGPGARTVVLITDGYISAEQEAFRLVRDRLNDASVFAFGIGNSVNRYLIEGIARAGMSEPFIVTGPAEASEVAGRFREYVTSPVLTDITVEFDGFESYDLEPAAVRDVFSDRPVIIQGKWRGGAHGTVTIEGVTGDGTYRRSFDISKLLTDRSDALGYLWARTRVADLSDAALSGSGREIRAEITRLGLTYNLLTPYTSFVAVDRIVRNEGAGEDVEQPQPLPHGVEPSAIGGRTLQVGPEPELWVMFVMLLCVLGIGARLVPMRHEVRATDA